MTNIYRITAYVGVFVAAIAKAHSLWISSTDPISTSIKILGIVIIVIYIYTPSDLLQSEG